ncbi:hypothetical protein, partial [Streptomyces dioscori]|uniref:hypothetical protein n=1 Tax=Streptomyces dioscori TaxID=2109333 RepID=UPI001BC8B4C1
MVVRRPPPELWIRGADLWTASSPEPPPESSGPPPGYFFSTAWPPNWLRSAAIIFICGESSCRD